MSSNLGSLTVLLGLDAADYQRSLTQAEKQAYEFGESIGTGIRNAAIATTTALAGLGVTAASAVAGFHKLIEGASSFADLADKTGASAEALASFAVAAGTSGVSMDKVASATNAMTRNLVGVGDESKAAGAALKAMGLDIKDFKSMSPEAQIEKVAKTLAEFEDGAQKSAVAMAVFGKSGADVLPFLKTLEEQGGRQKILTQEQIDLADAYADKQAKAGAELKLYAEAMATQAIPAITAFTGALTETAKEILGVDQQTKELKNSTAVADFADAAVSGLGLVVDAGQVVVRTFEGIGFSLYSVGAAAANAVTGDFKVAMSYLEGIDKKNQEIASRGFFSDKLAARLEQARSSPAMGGGADSAKRALNYNGPAKKSRSGDDPTKKLLDNQLKDLQRAAKLEEELLRDRNRMLDLYYGENLLSIEDYFAGRKAAQDEATAGQVAKIDEEIAALERYRAAAKKQTDRADAEGKINALLDQQEKLERAAGQAALEESFKKEKASRAYLDSIDQVRASLLELSGDAGGAAGMRAEIQYRDLLKRADAQGDGAATALITRLKEQTKVAADFGAASTRLSSINAQLSMEEERINTLRSVGAVGELSALQQIGDARSRAVELARMEVDAMKAAAALSADPKVALAAQQAEAALKNLEVQTDLVGQKLTGIFSDAFGGAFGDFITGTKTASEAFKSFANSVVSQLARMAAQEAAASIFGKGGAGGGINWLGMLGSAFGGGFSMAAGDYFGKSIGGTYGSATQAGMDSLIASLAGGGRAAGGAVSPFSVHPVGEAGPELFRAANGAQYLMTGRRGGTVVPSGQLGGEGSITLVNQTTGRVDNVVEQRLSRMERVLVLQERQMVKTADVADPNSRFSRTLGRSTRVERVR